MAGGPEGSGKHGKLSGRRRSRSESARLICAGGLGALAVAFALLNVSKVEVDWIVTSSHTPLIIVIAISLLVGGALGYVAARRSAKAPPR
jgi:uncharacterized integral membrane protein